MDGHQKTVVAWVVTPPAPEIRTLSPMTMEVLARSDGLVADGGPPVALERTGDEWKPVFTRRAGSCEVLLVPAPPVNAVPGRKTAVNDAAWLAERLPQGLVRASVLPPGAQRARRDLTRERRPCMRERVTRLKRGQPRVADANIKLAAGASESMGVSGRAMVAALLAGDTDPHARAELAPGRRRAQRDQWAPALDGRVNPPHRVVWTARGCQLDRLDEPMARVETPLQALSGPLAAALGLRETRPGLAGPTADRIVAETGTERRRVSRADHVASGAGVAPGPHARVGKRPAGKTRQGHRVVRTVLGQAAHAAARTHGPDLVRRPGGWRHGVGTSAP